MIARPRVGPWASQYFAAKWLTAMVPLRWTSSSTSTSSSVRVAKRCWWFTPALLTTMSSRPNASIAVSTMACAPAHIATLSRLATARPPRSTIHEATWPARSAEFTAPFTAVLKSFTTMAAPSDARASAYALPSPPPAPVIRATFPSRRPVMASRHRSWPKSSATEPRRPSRPHP